MYAVQVSGGIDTNRRKQTKPLCFIRSRTFLAGFLVYDISTVSNEIMWYQVQTIEWHLGAGAQTSTRMRKEERIAGVQD